MKLVFIYTLISCALGLIINETADVPPLPIIYNHMTAQFGVQSHEVRYKRSAPLVLIEPENGCDTIGNKNELAGAIVLVKRGTCNYFDKALAVHHNGGVGMVVGDDVNQESLRWMAVSDPGEVDKPPIPCVFVSKHTYDLAVGALERDPSGSVIATISLKGDIPPHIWTFPSLVQITTYVLIVFPALWALLTIKHFCRREQVGPRELRRRLRDIPEVLFTKDLLAKDKDTADEVSTRKNKTTWSRLTNSGCPICLENFEEQIKIKLLPCDHGFHSECIEPWIADHSDSCPICRQTVTDKLVNRRRSYCGECCLWRQTSSQDELRQPLIEPSMEANEPDGEAPIVINQEEEEQIRIVIEPEQAKHTAETHKNNLPSSIVENHPVERLTPGYEEVKIEESKCEGRTLDL